MAAGILIKMHCRLKIVCVNLNHRFWGFHVRIFPFVLSHVTSHPLGGVVVPPNRALTFSTKEILLCKEEGRRFHRDALYRTPLFLSLPPRDRWGCRSVAVRWRAPLPFGRPRAALRAAMREMRPLVRVARPRPLLSAVAASMPGEARAGFACSAAWIVAPSFMGLGGGFISPLVGGRPSKGRPAATPAGALAARLALFLCGEGLPPPVPRGGASLGADRRVLVSASVVGSAYKTKNHPGRMVSVIRDEAPTATAKILYGAIEVGTDKCVAA